MCLLHPQNPTEYSIYIKHSIHLILDEARLALDRRGSVNVDFVEAFHYNLNASVEEHFKFDLYCSPFTAKGILEEPKIYI